MEINIDLKELAVRESERVEWKEHGDFDQIANKIAKTISAFANDLSNMGGGYVVCGAKEGKDDFGFPKVDYTGLSANKLSEIEKKVLSICRSSISPPIAPIVHILPNPNSEQTKILVFTVIATQELHSYRDKEGTGTNYFVRVSRDTIEAKNGILTQLLIKKQKIEYFDHRINPVATEKDIDYIILRDYLQEMGLFSPEKALEDYLSETVQIAEFIPPLFGRSQLDGVLRPRNFTLLFFGKREAISRLFSQRHTTLSIYPSKDRGDQFAERHEITGNIVEQSKRAIELLNAQAYTLFDKISNKPNQIKYPLRALQEAVVNAVVHRDYEISEPNRITVFLDRIEIRSVGTLHWGVDKEKFILGKASPKWRNQCFAYLFNKLQLAQSEGQGIPTIIKTMKAEGCPPPTFEIEPESITCILPAHPRHQLIKDIREIQDKIILEKYVEAKSSILQLLNEDNYNFRVIELYCEICTKLNEQVQLLNFLIKKNVNFSEINPNTLVTIGETLLQIHGNENAKFRANEAFTIAFKGRLEESSLIKAVISIKKLEEPEKVISFVDDAIRQYPNLAINATMLQNRATAKMDLAKTCINTAKDRLSNAQTRTRAWEKCRELLEEAEGDLNKAMSHSENSTESYYLNRHIEFLKTMKQISKKPQPK